MNINTTIETVTPNVARKFLELNTNNRQLNQIHVKNLAKEMADGNWAFNGGSIVFNGQKLVDGQHRLHACIASNTPFLTVIVRGVGDDAFATIDQGRKRTGGDILSINGERNANLVSAALSKIHCITTDKWSDRLSQTQMLEYLDSHGDVREFASFIASKSTAARGVSYPSILVATMYLCACKDKVSAYQFFNKLLTGEGISKDEPVFSLRNRLIANTVSSKKISPRMQTMLIVKSWNATRKGASVRMIRSSDEDTMPEIL